jgi:GTP-binding protein
LVIDADAGVREQDKHVAGYAVEAGKGIVIVVNKWDLVKKDSHTMASYEKKIRKEVYEYNKYSEEIDKQINATTRVEDIDREDMNYDYDKRETNSNPWVLNGFDDLNDW